MQEPWDVPRTEAGRDRLIALVDEYKSAGKDREAGIALSRLADVVRWVGGVNDGNGFAECARLGAEAVALLRTTDDKKELCRALRTSAVMFFVDCKPLLEESLALAQEVGDVEEEAWTTFAMRKFGGGPDPMTERALALFEQCGSLVGQAACYRTLGFSIGNHDEALLKRSIELYEQAGKMEEAERGRLFLEVALRPPGPDDEPIPEGLFEAVAEKFADGSWRSGSCGTGSDNAGEAG